MTLDGLADTTVPAVQLHGALDLKRGGVGRISRNTNEYEPLLVSTAPVVDDLCADESWMSIKHLLWRRRRVGRGPVIDGGFRHYSDGVVRYPLPEGDVLSVRVGLDLGLSLDVEYLECSTGWIRDAVSPPAAISDQSGKVQHIHLRARIFWWGCIIAESAVIGLRRTLLASVRSMMTTWFCSFTFSRTQMKWSDSRVSVCN